MWVKDNKANDEVVAAIAGILVVRKEDVRDTEIESLLRGINQKHFSLAEQFLIKLNRIVQSISFVEEIAQATTSLVIRRKRNRMIIKLTADTPMGSKVFIRGVRANDTTYIDTDSWVTEPLERIVMLFLATVPSGIISFVDIP